MKNFTKEPLTLKMPATGLLVHGAQTMSPEWHVYDFETINSAKDGTYFCRLTKDCLPEFSFTSRVRNKFESLVGIAKCHPEDENNPELGKKLAQSRLISMIYSTFHELVWKSMIKLSEALEILKTKHGLQYESRQALVANNSRPKVKVRPKTKAKAKAKAPNKPKAKAQAKPKAKAPAKPKAKKAAK